MDALLTLEVNRVPSSADLTKAGDYCFIAKRDPIRKFLPSEPEESKGFWDRLKLWFDLSHRPIPKEVVEIVWPDYDAIILMCPHCNQPIGTTKDHRIVTIEPLTIEKPLACAYSRPSQNALPTIAFKIQDGKIMPA
jgi:hypothetical protein